MRIQLFIPRVWKIAAYTAKSFQLWFYRSCFVFCNHFCPPPCLLVSLVLSLKDMMQESERTNSIFMFSFSWKNVTFKKKKRFCPDFSLQLGCMPLCEITCLNRLLETKAEYLCSCQTVVLEKMVNAMLFSIETWDIMRSIVLKGKAWSSLC